MHAGQLASGGDGSQTAGADHAAARLRLRKTMRARRDERRAKSVRLAVVLSLFAVLLATALLVGRAVIDPVLRSAAATRDAKRVGDIVYWIPDGSFCRRLSFDNETASLTDGRVEQCSGNLPRGRVRSERNFSWGGR